MLLVASALAGLQLGLRGPERAGPGERITLELHLASDTTTRGAPAVDLPEGWRLLLPEPEVTLSEGARQQRRLLVQVPSRAPAGPTELRWCARDAEGASLGCASHRVVVDLRREATLEVLEAPGALLARDLTTIPLQVLNQGNGPLDPVLSIRCPTGLRCRLESPLTTLEPGQVQTLALAVEAGPKGIGAASIGLTLVEQEQRLASTEVPIEVLGGRSAPAGPFLTGRVDARARASLSSWSAGVGLQLQSTGTVSQTQAVALRLDGRGLDPTSQVSSRWSGQHWSVEGGWRASSLAPSLKTAEQGLDLQARLGTTWGVSGAIRHGEHGLSGRFSAFGTLAKARLEAGVLYDGAIQPLLRVSHPWGEAAALFDERGLVRGQLAGGIPEHLRLDASWRRAEQTTWRARGVWIHDWPGVRTQVGWNSEQQDGVHHQGLFQLQTRGTTPVKLQAAVGPTRQHGSARITHTGRDVRADGSLSVSHGEDGPVATAQASAARLKGTWRPRAELNGRWEPGEVHAAAGGTLEHHRGPTMLGTRASVEIGKTLEIEAGATLRHHTRKGQTLQASLDGRWRSGELGADGSIALSVPFRVPLPDPETTTVRGRLHQDGVGVGGVVVRLGERVGVTRSDGTFAFRGVAPGEAVLDVVDRMPAGRLPLQALPSTVTVTEDGGASVDIELGAAATVVATASWTGPQRSLEGVLVELTRDGERLRRLLDAQGQVELARVRPGTWNVRVDDRGLLPEGSTWEAPATLEVPAGTETRLALRASPKKRVIQMLDL